MTWFSWIVKPITEFMISFPFIVLGWLHTFKMGWPQQIPCDHFSYHGDQDGLVAREAAEAIWPDLKSSQGH